MNSMTGYGLFEKRSEDFYIKVEMKSVNNRYLDINVRMPSSIMYAEESVKSYKKSLKEKRTYVKTGNEYTLSIYDKDGELQSRVTYKRMSK